MTRPIFDLNDKTRVWAARFVSLPDADFMGMVIQEKDAPAPLIRYRFRYHDAGPGFDAPDTKRIYEVHEQNDDPKKLVELLDLAVTEITSVLRKPEIFVLDTDGELGTSAMKVVEWLQSQPWAAVTELPRKKGGDA